MPKRSQTRSGGQILVDQLKIHGVDHAFCVPGESYLAVLDALHDARNQIKLITCRQEGGAAFMAEAYGKLTGRPGICFVTRGPGATNASIGVHTAFQDSSPMILFIGQVARDQVEREAFQEVDFRRMFGPMAKWVAQIDDAARIPELVSQAFHRAVAGRPGPVVIALPEDMLTDHAEAEDVAPYKIVQPYPGVADLEAMRGLLSHARQPLMILGGGGWTAAAVDNIRMFAEANHLPVGTSFRCQDLFDNSHPNYAGHVGIGIDPALGERVKNADLLLVVGARLGEMTTSGYTLLDSPVPRQKLVHVSPAADELGRVFQPELGIVSAPVPFARALAALPKVEAPAWKGAAAEARADFDAWTGRREIPGKVQMWDVVDYLNKHAPDAIYTNGAGNFATWLHRFHRYSSFRSQLGPTSGAMGYGVPAAIAAKIARPERTVVCFSGDGDFLMCGQELATAVQYDVPVVIVIVNNGMYGTIRMHQEKHYPGRVVGTDLRNPHFAAYARAFGAVGEIVEETAQFGPAFERIVASGKPGIIDIHLDPQAITPNTTLDKLRAAAKKP